MEQQVEISDFDLRYQGYRIRNQRDEKQLLQGILENGIQKLELNFNCL